jgi:hypothetical protein
MRTEKTARPDAINNRGDNFRFKPAERLSGAEAPRNMEYADFFFPEFAGLIFPVLRQSQSKPTASTRNRSFMRYESPFRLKTSE